MRPRSRSATTRSRSSNSAAAELEIRRVALTHPDAAALMGQVQAIYVERYGNPDQSPLDPAQFTLPAGAFYVGYLKDTPVATGAWRRSPHSALDSAVTAEVKRMYVVEEAQRRGLARWMLAHLEAEVAAAGIPVITLGTGERQPEAIALYESSGYTRVPGFGHYADSPGAHFFAKRVIAEVPTG